MVDNRMDLNDALDEIDGGVSGTQNSGEAFDIYVKNGASGNKTTFYTTGANWLSQVFEGTAKQIGLDVNKTNTIYINESGMSTTEGKLSVGEFGLKEGAVLTIQQDGKVAAEEM